MGLQHQERNNFTMVLENKFGITVSAELARIEEKLSKTEDLSNKTVE